MIILLLTSFLSLPLYPVNPIQQDTVNLFNAHVTAGLNAPNGITNTGFELAGKAELMLHHPFVLRGGIDYRIGSIMANRLPDGYMHGSTMSLEILAYRGTNRLTGFVGGGIVGCKYFVKPTSQAADSLLSNHDIYEMSLLPALGFRMTAGLRVRSSITFEVSVSDIPTDFVYRQSLGPNRYRQIREPANLRDFKLTVGYIIPIADPRF